MIEFIRKYSTPLSTATFIVAGITGVMLFVGVHNRQVSELHEWFGIAFVLVGLLHVVRNGKAFTTMIQRVYSLIIVGVLVGGAALMIGPSLYASEPGQGNPVRTMAAVTQTVANAPIAQSAPLLGLSSEQVITRLRQKGIAVESPKQSLADVARKSNKSAPQLFAMILPQQPEKRS